MVSIKVMPTFIQPLCGMLKNNYSTILTYEKE